MGVQGKIGIRPSLPFLLLFSIFGFLALRFFQIQVLQGPRLSERAERILSRSETIPASRGRILDRSGRVLASSRITSKLIADPVEVQKHNDEKKLAYQLAAILSMDPREVYSKITGTKRYRVIHAEVDPTQAQQIRSLIQKDNVLGLTFNEQMDRVYPHDSIASHILGYYGYRDVQKNGRTVSVQHGISGIEEKFEAHLEGVAGSRTYLKSINPFQSGFYQREKLSTQAGGDVILSLDAVISSIVSEELKTIVEKHKPKWASVLVLDPKTGDVLAMESVPGFDPNRYSKFPVQNYLNPAVSYVFTPGSAFKPFIMAGAVEEGLVDFNEEIFCEMGKWRFNSRTIHDDKELGYLTPHLVMAKSSNIGMAKIGLRLGIEKTYRYLLACGFDEKTDIALPAEVLGRITPLDRWTEVYTLSSVSFGHEISMTPLRLAASFTMFANDGLMVEPRLVKGIIDSKGQVHHSPPPKTQRVYSSATIAKVREMLELVMQVGTGSVTASKEVSIAGKTGTTVKDYLRGGKKMYTSSFVGFAPAKSPTFLVCIVVDEPKGGYYASQVATPAAVRILERSLKAVQSSEQNGGVELVKSSSYSKFWKSEVKDLTR